MFSKATNYVRKLPARSSDWVNQLGPVALFGCDSVIKNSGSTLMSYFCKTECQSDWYAELQLCDKAPLPIPTTLPIKFPMLVMKDLFPNREEMESVNFSHVKDAWFVAIQEIASELFEKSYIPVNVGGDGSATLSMIESYKRLYNSEEVVVLHFSAHPSLTLSNEPLRVLLEKGLLRGVFSVGNRLVTSEDRKMRKEHKVLYTDMHAIFAKNIASVRDFKNEYPLFISLNCDVLDPVFAPASIRPVSGGCTTRELLHILYGMRGPKIIGADIFGFDFSCDVQRNDGVGLTQITMAKILKEVIVKAYTISNTTQDEGIARMQIMQRQGNITSESYP